MTSEVDPLRGPIEGTPVHLVTYNPEHWDWDNYDEAVEQTEAGEVFTGRWSVGQRRYGIEPGDSVFLLRQGRFGRGLVGIGTVKTEPYADDHWDNSGATAQYIEIDWLQLLPFTEAIEVEELIREIPGFPWNHVYSSGRTVSEPSASDLLGLWERKSGSGLEGSLTNPLYEEGAPVSIATRRYERSAAARAACIAVHGVDCAVCGMNFEARYGDVGRAYIHVHHVVPMATKRRRQAIDPKTDLRPVCANCHFMLHRSQATDGSGRIMTPDELRAALPK